MPQNPRGLFLLEAMFFVSGFCGLLYQTVWLRLAFAHFGVITPVVSVVVSVFMFGLGLGSWLAGRYVGRLSERLGVSAILLYAAVEAVIGAGALVVPVLFAASSRVLSGLESTGSWLYLAASGACIFLSVLPFACAMGMTYPVAIRFLEQLRTPGNERFGVLYASNTAGALAGVLVTVYALIELVGLDGVLRVGLAGNWAIGLVALLWGALLKRVDASIGTPAIAPQARGQFGGAFPRADLATLFVTGFCSMGMEVGWVRSFTPALDHAVYAFAFLLAAYLVGHAIGATLHTATAARGMSPRRETLVSAAVVAAWVPLLAADWDWIKAAKFARSDLHLAIALSIGTFAALLGWLTPLIVDDVSRGRPERVGMAYAVNIAGSMLGPLAAGYLLLPLLGARGTLVVLCLPLVGLLALGPRHRVRTTLALAASIAMLAAALRGESLEEGSPAAPGEHRAIYRDYTATTVARETNGQRQLLVNGNPMTTLSPITKMMAHLSFVLHGSPPRKVLVICLGMGTTFRSALSWGVDVTVVELLPGVKSAFASFYGDVELQSPNGRIVIDDGRRFLARTQERFDVIIIDPPPPPTQPASSLLYSVEFYNLVKARLAPGGVVQQWWGFPDADPVMTESMVRTVQRSFPYVRAFAAIDDPTKQMHGYHFMCSLAPLPRLTFDQFLARLPGPARRDLQEWSTTDDPEREMGARLVQQLKREFRLESLLPAAEHEFIITDRNPINEYFYLRERRAYRLIPLLY